MGNGVAATIGIAIGVLVNLIWYFHGDEIRHYPEDLMTFKDTIKDLPQRAKDAIGGSDLSAAQLRTRRLAIPVVAGGSVVALPVLFAVFPSFTNWPIWLRACLIGLGLVVAVLGTVAATRADDRLHELVQKDQASAIVAENRATLRDHFTSLLDPSIAGIPEKYHLTVYVPSADGRFLIPVFPPVVSPEDPAIFEIGTGAIGRLWATDSGTSVVIKGPAVSGPDHGLTTTQQNRYGMFDVVAARAILDEMGARIGAISAICRGADVFFDDEAGMAVLAALARGIAWIIPQAVRWMLPRTEEVKR